MARPTEQIHARSFQVLTGLGGREGLVGIGLKPAGMLLITVGPFTFQARWERQQAPRTCAAFEALLPYRQKLIQARWSGEAGWVPLGDFSLNVGFEDPTSHPAPGQLLFYPGGYSETEILFPYGPCCFASKMGQLAGNPFLTLVEGLEQLPALGRALLWEGAQPIEFRC